MDEIKALLQALVQTSLKARNEAEDDDKKDEKDKDVENKAKNEEVDKRDIIRQIMAIAGKHEDNEDVRTIAKLAEKLAYDKSEAGTADNKAKNEDDDKTDKRKLIDEIGGILKGKVDEEVWRTIIDKIEKVAYDKSEAGTADNRAKNKCKNEEDEKLYEELKEKVEKEAENKAKNSINEVVNMFYKEIAPKQEDLYISQAKGLELGKQIYG